MQNNFELFIVDIYETFALNLKKIKIKNCNNVAIKNFSLRSKSVLFFLFLINIKWRWPFSIPIYFINVQFFHQISLKVQKPMQSPQKTVGNPDCNQNYIAVPEKEYFGNSFKKMLISTVCWKYCLIKNAKIWINLRPCNFYILWRVPVFT